MVQLMVSTPLLTSYLSTFQFRYGAIDGNGKIYKDTVYIAFQFRYGAIDGECYCYNESEHMRFNSAMVQLMVNKTTHPNTYIN